MENGEKGGNTRGKVEMLERICHQLELRGLIYSPLTVLNLDYVFTFPEV